MNTKNIVGSRAPAKTEQIVVLLHSLGTDHTMWEDVTSILEDRYLVVTPDSRGHGSNDNPGNISLESWVDDIAAIVNAHPGSDIHLVGLSMGGIQAIACGASLGNQITSLTLANTFAALSPELGQRKVSEMREQIQEVGMAEYAKYYLDSTLVAPISDRSYETLRQTIAAVSPESYIASAEATFFVDLIEDLAGIHVPTLVITSDLDHKTPSVLSEQIKDGIPGARIITIAGAGHLSSVEKPQEFAEALDSFLKATQN